MTAKEKATRIYSKMLKVGDEFGDYVYEESAKNSALILVEEILDIDNDRLDCDYNFWEEVKREIEKL